MSQIQFSAVCARVHLRSGCPDTVWFDTDLPAALFPEHEPGQFRTRVPAGTGAQWARTNLGVEPTVIDLDSED